MGMPVEDLAREFSERLKQTLSAEELNELVLRNRIETTPNICHSHDFCDANMLLHEVFIRHGMDIADEGGRERWGELWDAAWNLSKSREFWVDQ